MLVYRGELPGLDQCLDWTTCIAQLVMLALLHMVIKNVYKDIFFRPQKYGEVGIDVLNFV